MFYRFEVIATLAIKKVLGKKWKNFQIGALL